MRNQTKREFLISEAKKVIEGYDIRLTLRQIYYRLVAKLLVENNVTNYKSLSKALVEARLNGKIPFSAMVDMTRGTMDSVMNLFAGQIYLDKEYKPELITSPREHFDNALAYFKDCASKYEYPRWLNQEKHIEIWVEKQALESLFRQVTEKYEVILGTCRGYPSWDFLHDSAVRLKGIKKPIEVYYFGDFDPSGKDIYRFVKEAMRIFGINVEFKNVAITLEQIKEYKIPPMPTKPTDTRSKGHIERYGDIAVELDAFEPKLLQELLEKTILRAFDNKVYDKSLKEEERDQKEIKKLVKKTIK